MATAKATALHAPQQAHTCPQALLLLLPPLLLLKLRLRGFAAAGAARQHAVLCCEPLCCCVAIGEWFARAEGGAYEYVT